MITDSNIHPSFQLTAARRRLAAPTPLACGLAACFNSQPPEGGWALDSAARAAEIAACFNSQPPEGGWANEWPAYSDQIGFNSQPPEGGWTSVDCLSAPYCLFQLTAARRRLAIPNPFYIPAMRFQLTAARRRLVCAAILPAINHAFQLTAARRRLGRLTTVTTGKAEVSTHSRPKAAGCWYVC